MFTELPINLAAPWGPAAAQPLCGHVHRTLERGVCAVCTLGAPGMCAMRVAAQSPSLCTQLYKLQWAGERSGRARERSGRPTERSGRARAGQPQAALDFSNPSK